MRILGNKKEKLEESKETKSNIEEKAGKRKKKISVGKVILIVVAVLVVLSIVSGVINSMKPMNVDVKEAAKGQIEQKVDLSGTVSAVESKQYFSEVSAVAGDIKVKKGDIVKKGDVIFTYDSDNIADLIQVEEFKLQAAEGGYDKAIESNGKVLSKLGEARTNLATLAWQIPAYENYIADLESKIEKKQNSLAQEGANLQISIIEWESNPFSDEYENLRKLVQQNSYEQAHNAEIQGWNKELATAKETLSYLKSLKSQMESQEDSAADAAMTNGGKQELEANTGTVRIESGNTLEGLKTAAEGIKAEKDGIIASIDVVSGASVNKGAQIFTIEYMDDLIVKVKLSKYDLEKLSVGQKATVISNGNTYDGELARISSIAEKTETGAVMIDADVRILNPDDRIVIGLEGKVSVSAGEANDAIVVPTDSINYGNDGTFVMVIRNGLLEKQIVETGLADDTNTQILSGINEGEQVVIGEIDYLTEGMKVAGVVVQD